MRNKMWSKPEKARLVALFRKSKKNLGECKRLVLADPFLKKQKRGWNLCYKKLKHMELLEEGVQHDTKRYPFAGLKNSELVRLDELMRTQGVGAARAAFPQFSVKQLRNRAVAEEIRLGRSAEEAKERDEKTLIKAREAGEISAVEFLEQLPKDSELRVYWGVIHLLLKKKRIVRNTDLLPYGKELNIKAKKRVHKLNAIRGILAKFTEWGALFSLLVDSNLHYFSNIPGFYEAKELYELVPRDEVDRIATHVDDTPQTAEQLAKRIYGKHSQATGLVDAVLTCFVENGLVRHTRKERTYQITPRGEELGVDAQSLKTLEGTALENALFVTEEESGQMPTSLDQVAEALKRDIARKTVPVLDLTAEVKGQDLTLVFIGEVLYGSQFTDQELLSWALAHVNKPTLMLTSGLVQGRFEVKNKAKTKGLTEDGGLNKIEVQFHSAGMLLDWLERITTSKVCVIQSDDDWRLADDYATLMHLREGKNPWKFGVDWSSFSGEMQRRLENKELRRKIRTQWEVIQTYMYRIGRSLLNAKEVKARIGISKSEYRLIMEIMVAKRRGFEYPKEYEQVVRVDALYGNIGNRIVSPDPLRIKVADNREIRLVHNAGFSDLTQYQHVGQHLDSVARHIGLTRQEVPWILADYHQEEFFAQYLMGTWIMNLPGMQNTRPAAGLTMTEWSTRILESKERRQSRVRKEPVSPSVPEMVLSQDGRIRFRILNNAVRNVLEAHKGQKEKRETILIATDMQFGSITNWPELSAKFIDYGLYARGATRMYINGDFIHGNIYPQHNAESRPMRLTSMHAQKMFSFNLVTPIILDAPNLVDLVAWLGNHEWNNFDTKRSGDMPLTFLETGLKGVLMERKRSGIQSSLERAMAVSRIRWKDSHNPQGDIINWPFFADTICGFKVAIQHMWQPFAGRTPADEGTKWLTNMARAARNIDLLIGGDKHSVWMKQMDDKLVVQAGASASQSGYELARGLMATVMFTLVEFSTHNGITVEFVPWEFLQGYKFQSPAYKGKDDEFMRPARGTRDYRLGRMAPFIENMIDEQTQYLEV